MNRAETFLAGWPTKTVALRSRTGTKVHAAYDQGPTFCGIRRPAEVVPAAKVGDARCCDRCFPLTITNF